ncbi:hypothetical protein [Streptomyces sp. SPB162]|uniref:hypothetical protein n=1 Tax=Streptomyces sp. SPB162 TaxID=2940560 RepID=UPI0024065AB8|nr:hypothetical protein [Streptomyces sp. SPB162]MDF9814602.1 hypothetical protein [Streptomyces sp. SPB162]
MDHVKRVRRVIRRSAPGMEGARVIFISPAGGFFNGKYSTGYLVKRAAAISEALTPGAGLEVVYYGGTAADIVRTPVVHLEQVDQWISEWATLPNSGHVLGPRRPSSKIEEILDRGDSRAGSDMVSAVSFVGNTFPGDRKAQLVIFRMAALGTKEAIRKIAEGSPTNTFWQCFSDADDAGSEWSERSARRGGLLPNLWYYSGEYWSYRAITLGFRRWAAKGPVDNVRFPR